MWRKIFLAWAKFNRDQQTLNISCEDKSAEPASISVQRQSVNLLDLLPQLSISVFLSLPNVYR